MRGGMVRGMGLELEPVNRNGRSGERERGQLIWPTLPPRRGGGGKEGPQCIKWKFLDVLISLSALLSAERNSHEKIPQAVGTSSPH